MKNVLQGIRGSLHLRKPAFKLSRGRDINPPPPSPKSLLTLINGNSVADFGSEKKRVAWSQRLSDRVEENADELSFLTIKQISFLKHNISRMATEVCSPVYNYSTLLATSSGPRAFPLKRRPSNFLREKPCRRGCKIPNPGNSVGQIPHFEKPTRLSKYFYEMCPCMQQRKQETTAFTALHEKVQGYRFNSYLFV